MWGSKIEGLKAKARTEGKVPPALKNRPELPYVLTDYLLAFNSLQGRRQYTMGAPLPIQASEIYSYAVMYGFYSDIQFFYRCIVEMDLEFFEHEKKPEKPTKAEPTSGPRPLKKRRN